MITLKFILKDHLKDGCVLPFHNLEHHDLVTAAAIDLIRGITRNSRIKPTKEVKQVVEIAARSHDLVYELGAKDNEEKSAEEIIKIIKNTFEIDDEKFFEKIRRTIVHGTKHVFDDENQRYEWERGRTLAESILHDADLRSLAGGYKEFLANNKKLMQEEGVNAREEAEVQAWREKSLRFLEKHILTKNDGNIFCTSYARKMWTDNLKRNVEKFRKEHVRALMR
ncbi:MAG: hypothetical protein ABH803_00675 [Candidatus Micrarchaeota archaeon]